MTQNLLLFAITFTIFLEIEFDFIFYVPYRSEEISPIVGQLHISLPGEQSLGGRPLLSPHVAPVAVAACESRHLTMMTMMTTMSVMTRATKWTMVSVITNMTMMTMSITPIKQT